jgi:hypothetical protein
MNKIALLLALVTGIAYAGPNSMVLLKRNNDDTASQQLLVGPPLVPGFLTFDPNNPTFTVLDSTLTLTSGVLSVTTLPVNPDWTAMSGLSSILNKPTLATVATSGSYADLSNKPTIPTVSAPAQSSASRTLNSAFQVSATRNALVAYSVQLSVTASIAGGQNGDVILEIASDSGFTANVQTVAISGLGQTYTLAIALQGVQPQTGVVSGFVPAGYYARLRTANNTGTPSYSYRSGQEVLL